jgi:hypothetical protein
MRGFAMSDERRDHALIWKQYAAGAGVTHMEFTVPTGQTWKIIGAWMGKTGGVARAVQWFISDGVNSHECSTVITLTALQERLPLYSNGNFGEALILHPGFILQASCPTLAGGEVLWFDMIYEIRYGETAAP